MSEISAIVCNLALTVPTFSSQISNSTVSAVEQEGLVFSRGGSDAWDSAAVGSPVVGVPVDFNWQDCCWCNAQQLYSSPAIRTLLHKHQAVRCKRVHGYILCLAGTLLHG